MSKDTVTCTEFKDFSRNTLQGFATLRLEAVRLNISDVAVHERDGSRWVQLPARPQLDKARQVIMENGRPKYAKCLWFESREVADAFAAAALAAIDRFHAGGSR